MERQKYFDPATLIEPWLKSAILCEAGTSGSGPAPHISLDWPGMASGCLVRYMTATLQLRAQAFHGCSCPGTHLRMGSTVNYAKSQLVPLSSPWVRVV